MDSTQVIRDFGCKGCGTYNFVGGRCGVMLGDCKECAAIDLGA